MSKEKTISEIITDYALKTDYKDLPDWVADRTKMYILDFIGNSLLGSTSKPAKILSEISYETGGREESVVVGRNRRTSCVNAAMINGTSGDANDWGDEHHTTGAHIGCVVVPTALAMAEREGADGKLLITSVALGYEVLARVCEAFGGGLYKQGFHPTAIGGVFAAAVAAGKTLGLNKKGLMNTLGIAGTQAFGCGHTEGWNKRMHIGMVARIGVLSALMGERNYEASTPGEIIEKALDKYSGKYRDLVDPTQITGGNDRGELGKEWRGMLTSWKPWPCCRFLHMYIKLAIDMVEKYCLKPDDIEGVHTKENETFHSMYETGLSTHERIMSPRDPIDAQFSTPWTVATAIIKREVSLYDYFTEEGLRNSDVLEFLHKVTGEVDPDHEAAYPWEWPVTMTIKTKDGREFTDTSMEWPGNPIWMPKYKDNPELFLEDIESKFKDITSNLEPYPKKNNEIVKTVKNLDKLDNVTKLTEMLRARPQLEKSLLSHVDI